MQIKGENPMSKPDSQSGGVQKQKNCLSIEIPF